MIWLITTCIALLAAEVVPSDTFTTSGGDLEIFFIGHGTLMMNYNGTVIHIDPYGRVGDYDALPEADLVLITHHHGDHLDPGALGKIRGPETVLILTSLCAPRCEGGIVMENGGKREVLGITIEAVPAYNIVHKRGNGEPFHVKGQGNGYVLTFGDTRVYVAGDTENIPEMKELSGIDIAFLPMNLPYTMTPQMVAQASRMFGPRILYPSVSYTHLRAHET